ncbi:hypothetical protein JZ751_029183 [Albula glossodonta]|uniref:Ig-like domain-containing protein n=1 Tax=Albula glossodonta TaxID=121402 RepID=A0A8T2PAW8_9TELE|nr:hypothetical protein JZ751_029183 [Albula glossodonta]
MKKQLAGVPPQFISMARQGGTSLLYPQLVEVIYRKFSGDTMTTRLLNAVAKPTVTCENINSSTVTLQCAGDQSPLTQYSWVGPGIQNKPGSELQLNNEDIQSSDAVYTCVVKNPVSEKRSDFYAKTCSASQGDSHT